MSLYTRFAAHLDAALDRLTAAGTLPGGLDRANVTVEPPRDASHGDLATIAAMVLAMPAGMVHLVAGNLGQVVGVREVRAVRHRPGETLRVAA